MAELLDSKGIEKACSAHTIVANRYYGANWVGLNIDHTKLFELSKKIKLEYTLDERLIDVNVTQLEAGYGDNEAEATYYGNKGINNSMHMVGYHRGQTVPFGVRFILTDDTRTPAFLLRVMTVTTVPMKMLMTKVFSGFHSLALQTMF